MSFADKIKRALGFGPDYDETEENPFSPKDDGRFKTGDKTLVDPTVPMSVPAGKVTAIFNGVIDIINASLPQFLAASVDPEKQKQYIYESLDSSLKEYLESLQAEAGERCRVAWQKESDELRSEMDALRKQSRELEAKKGEISEKQLSAERQKRALAERLHDLEAQVIALEAEKEQYEIEAKGLINKAKVASVYEKEIEDLRQENKRLLETTINGAPAQAADASDDSEELEAILSQLEQFEGVKNRLEEKIERQRVELEEARAKIESLNETIKDNLLQHANQQKAMQDEIDNLRTIRVDESAAPERKSHAPETPVLQYPSLFNDIDENRTQTDDLIGDTEWIK